MVINNIAPVASINLISGALEEGSALLFEADLNNDAVDVDRHTFQWRVEKDGAEYSVTSESDAASFGFTPDDNGSYEVFVEVSDGEATVTSSQVFVVENVAPSVTNVNVTSGNEGEPVQLTADVFDQGTMDELVAQIDWDGDGVFDETISLSAGALEHVYLDDSNAGLGGLFNVSVEISDGVDSTTATTSADIENVLPSNLNAGGPYTIGEGNDLTLNGSADDVQGDQLDLQFFWEIDAGDGNGYQLVAGPDAGFPATGQNGSNAVVTWQQLVALGIDDGPSQFNLRMRVVDDGGDVDYPTDSTVVTVENLSLIHI